MNKTIIKYKYVLFVTVIVFVLLALIKVPSIKFNTDFSLFLADDDPEYFFYEQLKSEIKDDESLLIIGVKNDSSVYHKDFIKKVQSFMTDLKQLKEVKSVKGLTNLSYPVKSLIGLISFPYINVSDSLNINYSKSKINNDFDITQHFVNKEGTVLLLWINIKDNLDPNEIENGLTKIGQLRQNYSDLNTYIWGRTYLKDALNEITKSETKKIIIWALLFLIIALSLLFKRKKAVIYSVSLVIASFIIFAGGMSYLNRPFGLMSNLFPTIILIVGISDIIHLSIKYNIEIGKGKPIKDALYITLKEIGWAIFITSFTTAIGFFTLYLSPMKALRDFGIEAGIAVILTFIITLLLAPILFSYSKDKHVFSINKTLESFMNNILIQIENLRKYPRAVMSIFVLLLIVAVYGINSINTNNLQFSIPNKSELYTNYSFFEKTLNGSRTFEIVLSAKNEHKLNHPKNLNSINMIHKFLDSLPYLSSVKSPILYYRILDKIYSPNKKNSASFILSENEIRKYENQFNKVSNSNYLSNKDKSIFKFNAQMKDLGRHNIAKINNYILAHINTLIDTTKVSVRLSGMDYLFDRAHEQRINNMIFGLALAIVMVALILGLLFRKTAIMIMALLLNIIPIIIGAGIMGFTDLELRSGTSIIFTIAFVIAVDDTIHLLSKFIWERKQGHNVEKALSISIQECGKAIIATSFILIGAFFILMFSGFDEIFTLGFITGTIILVTLAIDLILAPILMLNWFKRYL